MEFLAIKVVHILAAIVALGSNVTYAFWLRHAGADRDRLVFAMSGIRRLDNRVANPAYIVLLITGILLVVTGAFSFSAGWVSASIALYVATALLGILAFGPALRRQLAEAEHDFGTDAYAAAARRTTLLGILTTAIVVIIVILMVTKPF